MADWVNLPKDIVIKIVEHLELYEDFETMSKICSPWRAAAKEAKLRACNDGIESHTLPWLMLPERDESSNIRRFYSFFKNMICNISLPVPDEYDNSKKRLLSSHGWLLVVSERENILTLFKPFSKARIELPQITSKLWSYDQHESGNDYWHNASPRRFILSADPSTTKNFIVFISCMDTDFYTLSVLVFWRNGDHGWTRVMKPSAEHIPVIGPRPEFLKYQCRDVTFYHGEFYGVDVKGMIVKFETSSPSSSFQVVIKMSNASPLNNKNTSASGNGSKVVDIRCFYNLVESLGQLLVVRLVKRYETRHHDNKKKTTKGHMFPTRFEVFELDVSNGNVKQVSSLGNRVIFIGYNSSFSVLADGHNFKPNCIYYADTFSRSWWKGPARGGKTHCVYNLNKRKFHKIFYTGPSSDLGNVPQFMWVESPK